MATHNEEYNIKFHAETDTQSFLLLLRELDKIQDAYINHMNPKKNPLANEFKEAATLAEKLSSAMAAAYNPRLNTYNIDTLNLKLKQSGTNLLTVATSFSKMGAQGQAGLVSLVNELSSFNLQLNTTKTIFDKIGEGLLRTFSWSIYSSVINNISNGVLQAYGYVKALDSSLNDIRIVTSKSADEMDRFAEVANKSAITLGKGTKDYTNAALIYYQLGLADSEVQARTEATLKTASVTLQDTAAVSEQLTAIWNGYKVSAEEAELYVDKVAAVAATTAADLEELSTGMSKVASAANLLGVDVDLMNAMLATTVSVTRQSAESVGVAYKTIFARMSSILAGETAEDGATLTSYTEKMANLGFSVLDANGKLRDMGEVVEEIGDKWLTLSREQQIALALVMAGTRLYNNLTALFDNWDMYKNALLTSADAAGTLNKLQEIFMDSTLAHLQQLSTAAEGVYDSLLDAETINNFVDKLTLILKIVEGLTNNLGGLKGILASVAPLVLLFGNKAIGENLANVINNTRGVWLNKSLIESRMDNLLYLRSNLSSQALNDVRVQDILSRREHLGTIAPFLNASLIQEVSLLLDGYAEKIVTLSNLEAKNEDLVNAWNKAEENHIILIDKAKISSKNYIDEIKKSETAINNYSAAYENLSGILDEVKSKKVPTIKNIDLSGHFSDSSEQLKAESIVNSSLYQYILQYKLIYSQGRDTYFKLGPLKNNLISGIIKELGPLEDGQREQLKKALHNYFKEINGIIKNQDFKMDNPFNSVLESIKELDLSKVGIGGTNFKDKILEFKTEYDNIFKKSPEQWASSLDSLKLKFNEFLNNIPKPEKETEDYKKFAAAITDTGSAMNKASQAAQRLQGDISKFDLSATISSVAKVIGQIGTSINSINTVSNLIVVLSDNTSTAEEKFAAFPTLLTSIGFGLSGLLPIIKSVIETLELAGLKANLATGLIGLAALAITGIIAAYKIYQNKREKEIEKLKEEADAAKSAYEEKKKLVEANDSLAQSYLNLNEQYTNGNIGLAELRLSTYDLLISYGEHDLALQTLYASYEKLGKIIEEVRQKRLEEAKDAAQDAYNVELRAAKAEAKKLNEGFFTRNLIKGIPTEEESAILKDLGFSTRVSSFVPTPNGPATPTTSLNISSENLIKNYKQIQEFLNDENNKYLYKDTYLVIEKIISENQDWIDKLDEANINLLESEKDLFENSFKIDNSTFENYQKSRKNYVEGLMKRGYTEEGAEEAALEYFLSDSGNASYEIRYELIDNANEDILETILNLNDSKLLTLYMMLDYDPEQVNMTKKELLNLINSGEKISIATDLSTAAELGYAFLESGGENIYVLGLFKTDTFKQWLEDYHKDILSYADFTSLTLSDLMLLINDFVRKAYSVNSNSYKQAIKDLESYLKELEQSIKETTAKLNAQKMSIDLSLDRASGKIFSESEELDTKFENNPKDFYKILENYFKDLRGETISGLNYTVEELQSIYNEIDRVLADKKTPTYKKDLIEDYKEAYLEASESAEGYEEELTKINALQTKTEEGILKIKDASEGPSAETYQKAVDLYTSGGANQDLEALLTLLAAQEEFLKNGLLTMDTILKLEALGPSYYDFWMNSSGAIEFLIEKINTLREDSLETMKEITLAGIDTTLKEIDELESKESHISGRPGERNLASEEDKKRLEELREIQEDLIHQLNVLNSMTTEESFNISSILDKAKEYLSVYSTLKAAQEEYNKNGKISIETLSALISLGGEYSNTWSYTNGVLTTSTEELLKMYDGAGGFIELQKAILRNQIIYLKNLVTINSLSDYNRLKAGGYDSILKQIEEAEKSLGLLNSLNLSLGEGDNPPDWETLKSDYNYSDLIINAKKKELEDLQEEAEYLSGDALLENYEKLKKVLEEINQELEKRNQKLREENTETQGDLLKLADKYGIKLAYDEDGRLTQETVEAFLNAINKAGEAATTTEEQNQIKADFSTFVSGTNKINSNIAEMEDNSESIKDNFDEMNKLAITENFSDSNLAIAKATRNTDLWKNQIKELSEDFDSLSPEEQIENLEAREKLKSDIVTGALEALGEVKDDINEWIGDNNIKLPAGIDFSDLENMSPTELQELLNKVLEALESNELSPEQKKQLEPILDYLEKAEPLVQDIEDYTEKTVSHAKEIKEATNQMRLDEIEQETSKINKELEKTKEAQSDLSGAALIANLQKQLSLLRLLVEQEKKKSAELLRQRQALENTLKNLKGFELLGVEIQYNTDGTLANYYEIQKAIYENADLSEEVKQILLEQLDILNSQSKAYSDLNEAVEKSKKAVKDLTKEIKKQILETALKDFNAKIDVELNIEDAWRNLHKLRAELEGLKKNDYLKNVNMLLKLLQEYLRTNPNSTLAGGSILLLSDHVSKIMSEIRKMLSGAASSIYGQDQAQAFLDLQKYRDELGSTVDNALLSIEEVRQTYLSAIDDMISSNNKYMSSWDKINEILQNAADVMSLTYGDKAYDRMKKYLEEEQKNNLALANTARSLANDYEERYRKATSDEERMKYADAWQEAMSKVFSYQKAAIDNALKLFDEAMKNMKSLGDDIWSEIFTDSSAIPIGMRWDLEKEKAKDYLDYTQSVYERDALLRKLAESISNAETVSAANKLREVLTEILDRLNALIDATKTLTLFEVDRANALYELTLRLIALEEARDNKTKMRLRRDKAGNYRYEYVADDNDIADKQQAVDDAMMDLYNMTKDAGIETSDYLRSLREEFYNKVEELYKDDALEPDQISAAIAELTKTYNEKWNERVQELYKIYNDLLGLSRGENEGFEGTLRDILHLTDIEQGMFTTPLEEILRIYEEAKKLSTTTADVTAEQTPADVEFAIDIKEWEAEQARLMALQVDSIANLLPYLESMADDIQGLSATAFQIYEQALLLRELLGKDNSDSNTLTDISGNSINGDGTFYYITDKNGDVYVDPEYRRLLESSGITTLAGKRLEDEVKWVSHKYDPAAGEQRRHYTIDEALRIGVAKDAVLEEKTAVEKLFETAMNAKLLKDIWTWAEEQNIKLDSEKFGRDKEYTQQVKEQYEKWRDEEQEVNMTFNLPNVTNYTEVLKALMEFGSKGLYVAQLKKKKASSVTK